MSNYANNVFGFLMIAMSLLAVVLLLAIAWNRSDPPNEKDLLEDDPDQKDPR